MSKLVIETVAGGRGYRMAGGALPRAINGATLEGVILKAAVEMNIVKPDESLEVNSTHEMAQVLETIIGDIRPSGQIHEGIVCS